MEPCLHSHTNPSCHLRLCSSGFQALFGTLNAGILYNLGDHYLANPGKHRSNFVEDQPLLAEAVGLLFPF